MKNLVVDLDGTITIDCDLDYSSKRPNVEVIKKLKEYSLEGYKITIQTARNMRTYEGNLGKMNIHTLPVILDWLKKHDVPFDEVILGKPWCGHNGFYIDDKAIRPSEFIKYSQNEIEELLSLEGRY